MAPPRTHAEALKSAADPVFVASRKYQEQQTRADRGGAHVEIVRFARALVREARRYNIPLYAHEYARDRERQEWLRREGYSRAGWGFSPHNFGLAVDVIHGTQGWNLHRLEWEVIGTIGKEAARKCGVKVEWGGDPSFGFYDPAHWQLAEWRKRVA